MKLTGIKRYKDLNGGTPNCVSMTPVVGLTLLENGDGDGADGFGCR